MTKNQKLIPRAQVKVHLYHRDKIFYMDMIRYICPDRKLVFVYPHQYYSDIADEKNTFMPKYSLAITIPDPKIFNTIKFEWIKHLKTKKDPEDRVADFEWRDEQGLPDFDKLDRLIERRKTRKEKKAEIDEDMQFIKDCEEHGLDTGFLKEALKKKIQQQ